MTRASPRLAAGLVLALVATLAHGETPAPSASASPRVVDDARLAGADAEPGNWLAHGRTWGEQRFSPLAQIDASNVARLAPAWVYATGETRGHEATPLVVDGVMFVTLPWSIVVALDAATGRELWRHDPGVPRAWGRFACCDVVNRGAAAYQGKIYVGTLDGRLVALDAKTGARVWDVNTIDRTKPYTITGAPRVARGLVFIGNGGAEFGVRGYVSAYDAETGALRWRFYTVPAAPDEPRENAALELAAKTWSPSSTWESGLGGTVWDSLAFDPALDLLYVGVGNASPYPRQIRSPGGGDNLFLASILALRVTTGELVWHYQTTPGENWDFTATQNMILADLPIGGRTRRVLMQAPKNGFFYVLDRATGELLSADKYVAVNWASHVDLATGRPVETGLGEWKDGERFMRPGPAGGHNWHPMAYSPQTRLVYIPAYALAYPFHQDPHFKQTPLRFNTGEDFPAMQRAIDGFERSLRLCAPTRLTAWDPVKRERVWRVEHTGEMHGGVLATAGNLVFHGTGSDATLAAYRATDGELLWEAVAPTAVMAAPISYAVGGEQYVAVEIGAGGSAGMNFAQIPYENAGYVAAFKLGGKAKLPARKPRALHTVEAPEPSAPPKAVAQGQVLYHQWCMFCHGIGTKSGGLLPDLRFATRETFAHWQEIVIGGVRAERGMPSFAGSISREDAEAIRAYVVSQAHRRESWLEQGAAWLYSKGACVPASWLAD
ncbi:MAG TPA: PQQ-dependent dehydrogenase, methanol/ethanol family [Myxococcota bacterium]